MGIYLYWLFSIVNRSQGWADNRVYRIIWKAYNWYFKTHGPDFKWIVVKCDNLVRSPDNP